MLPDGQIGAAIYQIWILEGRDYRSPNDYRKRAEKTILGKEQKGMAFQNAGRVRRQVQTDFAARRPSWVQIGANKKG